MSAGVQAPSVPAGMVEVTQAEFFKRLSADRRDIMPHHIHPEFTTWETWQRDVWGWSTPGWKNPGEPKRYALRAGGAA